MIRSLWAVVLVAGCAASPLRAWDTWLGRPDKGAEPLGLNNDPRRVFTEVQVDGAPAIRISGEIWGALTSREEYDDFHLTLEYRWGEKRWPPRENAFRDSGILYYAVGPHGASDNKKAWMQSLECQIQEHDVGDFWSVAGVVIDIDGDRVDKGIVQYRAGGETFTLPAPGIERRVIKSFENERPGWNTVEVICRRGTCQHVVNGKVNLVLRNPRASGVPLRKGKIQIQSEGAEVFYRNITITRGA